MHKQKFAVQKGKKQFLTPQKTPQLPSGRWFTDYTGQNHKSLWVKGLRSYWELTGWRKVKANHSFMP